MSDLISKSTLIESVRNSYQNGLTYEAEVFIEAIEDQPTVLNIDEALNKLQRKIFSAECYSEDFDGVTIGNLLCLGDVYEVLTENFDE